MKVSHRKWGHILKLKCIYVHPKGQVFLKGHLCGNMCLYMSLTGTGGSSNSFLGDEESTTSSLSTCMGAGEGPGLPSLLLLTTEEAGEGGRH